MTQSRNVTRMMDKELPESHPWVKETQAEATKRINDGVHRTHCCVRHGCKYSGYSHVHDCPVEQGRIKQEFPCEDCNGVMPTEPLLGQELMKVLESHHDDSYAPK